MNLLRTRALANAGILMASGLGGCSLLAPPDSELIGGISLQPSGGTGGFGNAGGASGSGNMGGTGSTGGAAPGMGGTGGSPNPTPEEPALSNLSLWLQADSELSTTDNQVTAWASPSMELFPAYSLEQTNADLQPILGAVSLGRRALPTLTGAKTLTNGDAHDFTSQSGYAFFVVLVPDNSDGDGEILTIAGAKGYRLGLWQRGGAMEFGSTDPASPKLLTASAFMGTEAPVMIEVLGSQPPGGEMIVSTFINGQAKAGGAAPTWDHAVETGFRLGSGEVEAPGFAGAIAEVLIYNEPLDGAARFGTETYLQAKWACCK